MQLAYEPLAASQSALLTSPSPAQATMMAMQAHQAKKNGVNEMRLHLLKVERERLSTHKHLLGELQKERDEHKKARELLQRSQSKPKIAVSNVAAENDASTPTKRERAPAQHISSTATTPEKEPVDDAQQMEPKGHLAGGDGAALDAVRAELAALRAEVQRSERESAQRDVALSRRHLQLEATATENASAAEEMESLAKKAQDEALALRRELAAVKAQALQVAQRGGESALEELFEAPVENFKTRISQQQMKHARDKRKWLTRLGVARSAVKEATAAFAKDVVLEAPPPPLQWLYLDANGKEQGPFAEAKVSEWFAHRLLPADLPMRAEGSAPSSHSPLNELVVASGGEEPPFVVANRARVRYEAFRANAAEAALRQQQLRETLTPNVAANVIQTAWRGKMARDNYFWLLVGYDEPVDDGDPLADAASVAPTTSIGDLHVRKTLRLESKIQSLQAARDAMEVESTAKCVQLQEEVAGLTERLSRTEEKKKALADAKARLEQEKAEMKAARHQEILSWRTKIGQLQRELTEQEANHRKEMDTLRNEVAAAAVDAIAAAANSVPVPLPKSQTAEVADVMEQMEQMQENFNVEKADWQERERRNLDEHQTAFDEEKRVLQEGFTRALDEQTALLEKAEKEHDSAVAALTEQQTALLERAEKDHASTVAALRKEHEDFVEALRQVAEDQLAQQEKRLKGELADAKAVAQELDDQFRALGEAVIAAHGPDPPGTVYP